MKLAAILGRFLDGLLRLLLGADEEHAAPFADGCGQKVARRFELAERLAEVDDVDAVARVEDKRLHLGIPPLGLVPEMNARFQQFLNANTYHNFPLVKSPAASAIRTIPRNTGLISVLLWPPSCALRFEGPRQLGAAGTVSCARAAIAVRQRASEDSREWMRRNRYF